MISSSIDMYVIHSISKQDRIDQTYINQLNRIKLMNHVSTNSFSDLARLQVSTCKIFKLLPLELSKSKIV